MEAIGIILQSTLRAATPLVLAAVGGLLCERTGVVNIALEGIMLTGAFAAAWGAYLTGSGWAGTLAAVAAGLLLAWLHGVVSIRYRANQVVSGVAINILAAGLTTFAVTVVWGRPGLSPSVAKVPDLILPWLEGIPLLGRLFARMTPFAYLALAAVAAAHYLLFHTPLGLRMRAVGEHPKAAETAGVSVARTRYLGVLLSGALAGLAGASLSVGLLSIFQDGMTAGRGFIALAAVVFGKWHPAGALLACLLFGMADAAQIFLQTMGVQVPAQLLLMAPYLLTILALAGVVGRSRSPAASGLPYE